MAGRVHAQASECAAYSGSAQRVCVAAIDATRGFHPVAGLLVSGGNPVLGTGENRGPLGRFSLTLRANAANVVLPDLSYAGGSASIASSDELYAPVPLLELAAGVYRGLPSGLLALDLLGSAQLLPTDQIDHLAVEQGARRIGNLALGLGLGARIGLLRESGSLPALSVSLMRRSIPELTYGEFSDGDQYRYSIDLHATNIRLVASKNFSLFEVAGGLGWDRYTGNASIRFRDPDTDSLEPEIPFQLDNSRLMMFLNAGVDLSVAKLVGEVGYQGARDQGITTDFEDFDPEQGKIFAGLGLRLGW